MTPVFLDTYSVREVVFLNVSTVRWAFDIPSSPPSAYRPAPCLPVLNSAQLLSPWPWPLNQNTSLVRDIIWAHKNHKSKKWYDDIPDGIYHKKPGIPSWNPRDTIIKNVTPGVPWWWMLRKVKHTLRPTRPTRPTHLPTALLSIPIFVGDVLLC